MEYATKLRERRQEEGISQKKLAEETGYSQQSISLWESGINLPNIDACVKLADFYKISLDELVGRNTELTTEMHTQLNRKQQTLLLIFDKLTHDEQMRALGYMEGLYLNRNNQAF